ncbi:hypothetical protein [Mangrovicella endophytica]|uniref:hypothetical protein n=1 Tax=Mangrovicella endophytica TaxID=2066697 RepID=UPI000C9E032B|nr:hypothetical protein [Mangrovicella endophytica]
MSRDELLEQLRPARLPAGYEAFNWHDLLAAFALGIVVALLLRLLLQLVAGRPEAPQARIARELTALEQLPASERLVGQARIYRALRSDSPTIRLEAGDQAAPGNGASPELDWDRRLSAALYRREDVTFDLDAFDAEILRRARESA